MTDDERQIRDCVQTWITASNAGDLATVLELMTDDVVFLKAGRPPFGKREFAEISAAMRDATMDGHADIQEIELSGHLAFVRNRLQITITVPGQSPRRMAGQTMSVLRKEADGRWRIARDANLVMPEGAAPA